MWGWQGWFVLADCAALFTVLFFAWVPMEFAMVAAVLVLGLARIVTVQEMTEGFANSGVLAVCCLFVVAEGLTATGALDYFAGRMLGRPHTLGMALTRMMILAAFLSMWISSTALVAIMIPVVLRWSKQVDQSPSKFLLPLAYAAHLGGSVTLVGTTTNLVLAGVANSYYCTVFPVFMLASAALPACICGLGVLLLVSPKVLCGPQEYARRVQLLRAGSRHQSGYRLRHLSISHSRASIWLRACCSRVWRQVVQRVRHARQQQPEQELPPRRRRRPSRRPRRHDPRTRYVMRACVSSESRLVGGTIVGPLPRDENAPNSPTAIDADDDEIIFSDDTETNLQLLQVVGQESAFAQHEEQQPPTSPYATVLRANDVLTLSGSPDDFLHFARANGLVPISSEAPPAPPSEIEQPKRTPTTTMWSIRRAFTVEATVRANSWLVGKTANQALFHARYQAWLLGVVRANGTAVLPAVDGVSVGDVVLHEGDMLAMLVTRTVRSHDDEDEDEEDDDEDEEEEAHGITFALGDANDNENGTDKIHQDKGNKKRAFDAGPGFDWNARHTRQDLKPKFQAPPPASTATPQPTVRIEDAAALEPAAEQQTEEEKYSYVFAMRVLARPPLRCVRKLPGLTVQSAGLCNIPEVNLVAIARSHQVIGLVRSSADLDAVRGTLLRANDVVFFSGPRSALPTVRRIPGLEDEAADLIQRLGVPQHLRRLVEVALPPRSQLVGKSVRESRFRSRYGGVMVALRRGGNGGGGDPASPPTPTGATSMFENDLAEVVLQAGDVLVVDAGPDFCTVHDEDTSFLLTREWELHSQPPRFDRFYLAVSVSVLMVSLSAGLGQSLVLFAASAVGVMLATKVLSRERAHRAVDWRVVITVASAFGLSSGMTNSGVAAVLGRWITALAGLTGTGEVGILACILICTELLCALITAKAGALLMFPIAASAANQLGVDPTRMMVALMLGASDYTMPQSHNEYMLVLVPGAYRFYEYQLVGAPVEIFINVVQILCLALFDRPYVTIPVSILFLALCVVADQVLCGHPRHGCPLWQRSL